MPSPEENPDLNALCDGDPLARALAKLRPAPPELLDSEFYFAAGVASQERPLYFWRTLALVQLPVWLAGLAGWFAFSTGEPQPVQSVVVYRPAALLFRPLEPEEAPPPRLQNPSDDYPTQPAFLVKTTEDAATAEERARWATIRRNILLAGLGAAPSTDQHHSAAAPPAWQGTLGLPGNIYAAPPPASKPMNKDPE